MKTGVGTVGSYDVSSAPELSFGVDSVTLTPTGVLELGSDYHILIDATAIEDDSSNAFVGIADAGTWTFSTAAEDAAPIVHDKFDGDLSDAAGTRDGSFLNPETTLGSTGARLGSGYLAIDPTGDVNTPKDLVSPFLLDGASDGEGTKVEFTTAATDPSPQTAPLFYYDFENDSNTIGGVNDQAGLGRDGTSPTGTFASMKPAAISGSMSLALNGSAGSWVDASGSLSLNTSTANNARIGEGAAIIRGPINGNLDDGAFWAQALGINQIADLASGAETPLSVDQVTDSSAPTLPSKVPADGASNVGVGFPLVATFDQGIALEDGGTITIRNLGPDAGPDEVITIPDGRLSVSGMKLTVTPSADLKPSNDYAVRISSDAIKSLTTTPSFFAGISDDTTWNFMTYAGLSIVHFEFDGDLTDSAGSRNGTLLNAQSSLGTTGARLGSGYLAINTTGDANFANVGFQSGGPKLDLGTGTGPSRFSCVRRPT